MDERAPIEGLVFGAFVIALFVAPLPIAILRRSHPFRVAACMLFAWLLWPWFRAWALACAPKPRWEPEPWFGPDPWYSPPPPERYEVPQSGVRSGV